METNHFSLWHDKAGNAVAQPLAGVTDPGTGVTFPDLNAKGGELNQTNLILPEPCEFVRKDLPDCSIVRPTSDLDGGAVATINSFTDDRLFEGQSSKFFRTLHELATQADAATRHPRITRTSRRCPRRVDVTSATTPRRAAATGPTKGAPPCSPTFCNRLI